MKKRNLYHAFFRSDSKYLPYEKEAEHLEELFAYLRLKIAAYTIFAEQGIEELSVGQSAPVSGEAEEESLSGQADTYEPLTQKQVKNAVKSAKLHIKTRLMNSGDVLENFRFFGLTEQLGFSDFEKFVFLMAYSVTYAVDFTAIYMKLIGEKSVGLPTLQLAAELFRMGESVSEEELAEGIQRKKILYRYFLETDEKPLHPTSYIFRLSDRVCTFLCGVDEIKREIGHLVMPEHVFATAKALPIRREKKKKIIHCLEQMLLAGEKEEKRGHVLQIYGPAGIGKKEMLSEIAGDYGFHILFVDLNKILLGKSEEILYFLVCLGRECALTGAIPCFYGYEPPEFGEEFEIAKEMPKGLAFIYEELRENYRSAIWLSEEKADYLLAERLHISFVELPLLSAKEREVLWKAETEGITLEPDVNLTACAGQYILTPGSLKEVVRDAGVRAGFAGRGISKEDIREAVAAQVKNQLGSMATHIRSVYTWDDLVIGEKEKKQLQNICDQVRYRGVVGEEWGFYKKTAYGRGICAMFYGQPGTGKTMAAQVVANELGLELYRIDLSQMVSKYIGETQKNVTKLFERAKNTNAVLFFDEADSLFSKRSEVKDSHDRNANAETAHLLQKLEDYEGITILATNYANNIDDAFKRRIKFMVNFVFPEAEVRRKLWKTILPDGVPQEETIDLDFFADEFELSGSSIKEILTNAAFLAAAKNRGLKNEDIIEAVTANFEKQGKILTDKDFGYLI